MIIVFVDGRFNMLSASEGLASLAAREIQYRPMFGMNGYTNGTHPPGSRLIVIF